MVDGKRLPECFDVSSFCLRKHVTANAQVKGTVAATRDGSEWSKRNGLHAISRTLTSQGRSSRMSSVDLWR